jgi:DNA polymerase III epsilon subunit-like protein
MLKTLILDIETAPKRAYVWRMWKENVSYSQLISDWFMLTWSAKWHGEKHIYGDKLSPKEVNEENDYRIVHSLRDMMDEADVIVAHNGDKFDLPSINTRMVVNGITQPSPYRSVDTLKIAKRNFKFSSNRLDYLGEILGLGRKLDTGGFDLWARCMAGEAKAFQEMLDYNMQDVVLLEAVYDELRPYHKTHPNQGVTSDVPVCPKCGGQHMQKRGYSVTQVSKYQRYQCQDCGSWARGRTNLRDKEEMNATLLGV